MASAPDWPQRPIPEEEASGSNSGSNAGSNAGSSAGSPAHTATKPLGTFASPPAADREEMQGRSLLLERPRGAASSPGNCWPFWGGSLAHGSEGRISWQLP